MFENYSADAQRVVSSATIEARHLHHSQVGTEHLLLGLLAEGDDTAELLRAAGASLSAARHMVAEVAGLGSGSPAEESLPLTPRAQRALDRAARFSRQDRAPDVTAAHVLLGVLDVEGLACQVLRGLDVDIGRLRDAVGGDRRQSVAPPAAPDPETPREIVRPKCPRCGAALEGALVVATLTAHGEDDTSTAVAVIHCGSCGTTVGVLPS